MLITDQVATLPVLTVSKPDVRLLRQGFMKSSLRLMYAPRFARLTSVV